MAKKASDGHAKPEEKLQEIWKELDVLPWRELERLVRAQYFMFVRKNSLTDAEAARKLGLAPPNYYRMCKELGLK